MRSPAVLLVLLAAAPAVAQQADSARVYDLNEVQALPVPRNTDAFRQALHHGYPPQLRDAGVGGTVEVSFVVGPDGTPADVQVLSTPDSAFHTPTVQAVSLLRFTPAEVDGRPVPVRVVQPITWRVVVPVVTDDAQVDQDSLVAAGAVLDAAADVHEWNEVEVLPRPVNVRDFQRALREERPSVQSHPGVEAEVQVRFRVNEDGRTSHATITRTTDPRFNTAALRALQVLRFTPGRVEGRPVKTWVEMPISFAITRGHPNWQELENGSPGSRARRDGSPSFTTPTPR